MNRLRQLIHEVHRRSLWQVLGIYVVASWAVLQVVDTLGGALRLPDWTQPFALVLLIVGLPVVLATAFVQEGVGRKGAQPAEAPADSSPAVSLFTWGNAFGGGVLAFALWGVVAAGWVLFGGGTRDAPRVGSSPEASVAVMPCDDLSPAGDQAPLAQGLAEGIINGLAQLPDLKVSGITSVIALSEQSADIATVAETLGVATVLECGLQQAGEVIRIRSRLVEAASGSVLWSEQIDRPADNIFAIEDEVARAVTDRLQLVFSGGATAPLVTQGTSVPEAHQAYLRGRYLWNQRTVQSLESSIGEFEGAIELDSTYAEAWSGLADAYLVLPSYADPPDYQAVLTHALPAAERAVALRPDLGMTHSSLGYADLWLGRWDRAEREFQLAIELSPQYATAHGWYSIFLLSTGRPDEAVSEATVGVNADPVSPAVNQQLGLALQAAGRLEDAIAQYRKTIGLQPTYTGGLRQIQAPLLLTGKYQDALEAALEEARLRGQDTVFVREAVQAAIRYAQTREPQAFALPEGMRLVSSNDVGYYVLTGQRELALEAVSRFMRAHVPYRLAFGDALFARDFLGGDPRYQALLREAEITW